MAETIRKRIREEQRTYRWLAQRTGLPYKRLLAELKHGSRLSLEVVLESTDALGMSLSEIADGDQSEGRAA